jgi:F0F1-type ATP synthase membrane subunit b/b'
MFLKSFFTALFSIMMVLALISCEKKEPMEKAQDKVEQVAGQTTEAVEESAGEAVQQTEETAEKMQEKGETTGK